ncbi:MAG TPA: vitamin B12-dependent ribonucleotide reductase [Verrucomicrobiota bacterium]|nr:vitamin B12-dependent ribonucleotide reductase [Verrucomicrobiota bacterium]HNU50056.1 vitamin B12-dependent ribonucleotide reductase [Verrucomicrobiota bacterium]
MIDTREQEVSGPVAGVKRRRAVRTGNVTRRRGRASGTAPMLLIPRIFSDPKVSPFDQIEWERRTAEITDEGGKSIFRQDDVEVPKSWSLLATKVVCSKYFYGDPQKSEEREHSVRQLIHRVTRTIADWGVRDGYFSAADGEVFYDELTWLCLNQYAAFNSPVWFNVGLFHQYGVGRDSARGNFFFNRQSGVAERAPTQYEYPQSSACFIQSVEDTMESIMQLAHSEAMLFKYGSGTGTDLTPIRSCKEKLSGGGRPSGPLSFLRVYDQVANVVKSGGKTRRAAKMNTLRDWHGDIEEFIEAKAKEERKARALMAQGYDGSFNGDAYGSVMYQNENLSVRVSDAFMQAAVEGSEWWTRSVTTGQPLERKSASSLLDKIAEGTWLCGDPGLQYDGAIQRWHTCKGTEAIHSTNPCSEYVFLNNTACNLASLNLLKFKKEDGTFDLERFKAAVRLFITAQEIIVDNASYPTPMIAENSHRFRTLGLGYANLGSLIMSYGLPYDSEDARALAGAITAVMTGHAYEQSAAMAALHGPFAAYRDARCTHVAEPLKPDNVESMLGVIELHRQAVEGIASSRDFGFLKEEARACWDRALARGRESGYRNAQVTVLAPTGTIGFLMDCDTTGVEPDIALIKYKVLAGGGKLKIVNRTVPEALAQLGYAADAAGAIVAHVEQYETIEDVVEGGRAVGSGLRPEHLAVFDCAFRATRGRRCIHYLAHLRMMAAVQPFISGAISKTVNLPTDCSVADVRDAYVQAWRMGLKCVAIYRDGSKMAQPLNTGKTGGEAGASQDPAAAAAALQSRVVELEAEVAKLRQQLGRPLRRRLPETRMAVNHKFNIAGHEGYLNVGLFENGQPGELFITMAKEGSTIGGLMDTIATLTSLTLQYGVPLDALVKKFSHQRYEPSGTTRNPEIRTASSVTDYVFRWLAFQFLEGYREEHRPDRGQQELPMPGLHEEIKKRVNKPIPELPVSDEDAEVPARPAAVSTPVAAAAAAQSQGQGLTSTFANMLDAPPCSKCGHVTVRNGTCFRCPNCGSSEGCS